MEVVAEGVETEAQLALLKQLKCDQTQGYLLGRPMDISELRAMMVDIIEM
jgi:EAL domain-containing protein (putative c-di-GMP-specific phosphodiesterase class I)